MPKLFSDDEGKPIKGKYVGESLKNLTKGTGRGVKRMLSGDPDFVDEYGKMVEESADITSRAKKDRPEKYAKGGAIRGMGCAKRGAGRAMKGG